MAKNKKNRTNNKNNTNYNDKYENVDREKVNNNKEDKEEDCR